MNTDPVGNERFGDKVHNFVEDVILWSRYLLIPLILTLLFVILKITMDFFQVLSGATEATNLKGSILQALELLDITMIANLIWLVSAGSYFVFIDNTYPGPPRKQRPRCLTHVSAGILKEKLAGSLVGVSSVYLLQVFLNLSNSSEPIKWNIMGALLAIHTMFIVGLIAFSFTNSADHHNHEKEEDMGKNLAGHQ